MSLGIKCFWLLVPVNKPRESWSKSHRYSFRPFLCLRLGRFLFDDSSAHKTTMQPTGMSGRAAYETLTIRWLVTDLGGVTHPMPHADDSP